MMCYQRIVPDPTGGQFVGFGEGGLYAGGAGEYQSHPHYYS